MLQFGQMARYELADIDAKIPAGTIIYDSAGFPIIKMDSGEWWDCDGGDFDVEDNPVIAELYPSGELPVIHPFRP